MNASYIEKCVLALPPDKQAAARAAFKEISEGGDDSVFSKILVTLEATSAYAAGIPQALAENGERFLKELDNRTKEIVTRLEASEAERDEHLRDLLRQQLPALVKPLAIEKLIEYSARQTAELGRIERSVARLRHARVGGMVFLMLIGALLGAAGLCSIIWPPYQDGQRAAQKLATLEAAGISWDHRRTKQGELVLIEGPPIDSKSVAWRRSAAGQIVGANILYPTKDGK